MTAESRSEVVARRELARQQRKAELLARRADVRAAKQRAAMEGAERKRAEDDRLAAEQRIARTTAAHAYESYLKVREHVRRMCLMAAPPSLTAAEREVVAGLARMWHATPDTIARLRRCCQPIAGVRAEDYDAPGPELTLRLKRDYRVLRRQVGPELFVQEWPQLGGFGYVRGGHLINEDTLKYFAALVALQDAAVLGAFRGSHRRRLAWEIGGGWGGFAYQFKTVCPNVTYLITGLPEFLLVSAVYLSAAFPSARCRFYGEVPPGDFWRDWEQVDFIFAPESACAELRPPRLDLTLDVMALSKMSVDRARLHVQRAFDLGSPYVYSLLPIECAPDERAKAWGSIERLYWPHPVPARAENIPPVVDGPPLPVPGVEYAHLVGWRRLRA